MMESITLAGVAGRATAPLLQVYGGLDPGSPPAHAERIAAEYGGPVTNVVFDDGVHILNNIWYKARPLVADWLAETSDRTDALMAMDYAPDQAKQAARERFPGCGRPSPCRSARTAALDEAALRARHGPADRRPGGSTACSAAG